MPVAYSLLESPGSPLFCYRIPLAVISKEGMTLHGALFMKSASSLRRSAGPFEGKSHEYFGNFQSLLAEGRLKSIYDARIEVGPGSFYDGVAGFEG